MTLSAGTRLGPYEILSAIGAGGMGEVYRARDPRLNRLIAIKLLPATAAKDAERRERFEREARAIGALNHPGIVTIYSVEQADGQFFLTMELVEGHALTEAIPRGGLPLDRVLRICIPVVDAVAAAHQKGITHRDLKPANIMIGAGEQDGRVKVLDFGLAKLTGSAAGIDAETAFPTALETGEGRILGTVAYMSPEQAEGKAIDARSDLFSLGVILYEMATGRRPFTGDTSVAIVSAIIKDTPTSIIAVNPALPRDLGRIARRALAKDPERRYQTAKDLRNDLDELKTSLESGEFLATSVGSLPVGHSRRARGWPWIVAILSWVGLLLLAFIHFHEQPVSLALVSSQIPLPVHLLWGNAFSLSPDGHYLTFPGAGPDGVVKLWLHSLDSMEVRPLPGTETVGIAPPFWSPNSAFIAYDRGGELMKVSISGGAPQPVCQLKGLAVGGAWNDDDVIVVGNARGGLGTCSASGGAAAVSITIPSSTSENEIHLFPSFLPDGKHFLYSRISRTAPEKSGVFVGSLASDAAAQSGEKLLQTGFSAAYVAKRNSIPGQILFMLDGVLYAQRFDDRRLVLIGDRVPLVQRVGSFLDFAFFSASSTGLLVSKAPDPDTQLTWFERKGYGANTVDVPGPYTDLALSPDGTRAVVVKHASRTTADQDLWVFDDVSRDTPPRKRTFEPDLELFPVWMPDNDHVIFSAGGGGENIYEVSVSGSEGPRPLRLSARGFPTSVSGDPPLLLMTVVSQKGNTDLSAYPLGLGPAEGRPFLTDQRDQGEGQLSPDGQWVAYVSNENGPRDVFVAPVSRDPATGVISAGHGVRVSKGGGVSPRWSRRTGELFYLTTDGTVMVAARTDRGFGPSAPTQVRVPEVLPFWGVSPDGNRFLLAVPVRPPSPFDLRMNWDVGLRH